LWDADRAQPRLDFDCPPLAGPEPSLFFRAVAFSPDGRVLAAATGNRPLVLYEVATGRVRRLLAGHRASVTSLRFTPDGRRLLSTSGDRTGLVWDVSLSAVAGSGRGDGWDGLADGDAQAAYRTMARLAVEPDQAVALLRDRLRPAAQPDDAALDRLVADLDSPTFAVRSRATAEVDRLGGTIVPGVRARLAQVESLELRRRLEQFLDKHDRGVPPPEALRQLRAVELLEHLSTPAARALLRNLAGGSPAVRLTQDAAAALRRLAK
jgi:dipeptidyl aminopeptidase/acylaminoacyl peptidase